jgi:hypothetical protein
LPPGILKAEDLLPWNWTVKPSSYKAGVTPCPSVLTILGLFAAVNTASAFAGVIAGYREVTAKLTCGLFGKSSLSKSIYIAWLAPLAFNLLANVLIAMIIKETSDYGLDFTVGELALFYVCRPRLSWIFLSCLDVPLVGRFRKRG